MMRHAAKYDLHTNGNREFEGLFTQTPDQQQTQQRAVSLQTAEASIMATLPLVCFLCTHSATSLHNFRQVKALQYPFLQTCHTTICILCT